VRALGQVEEVKEDSKVFFEYLKESVAVNYIFRDLIQEISRATWESKFESDEKRNVLFVLGQIEEDYDLINGAIGTTEVILQEHDKEFGDLRIEAVRELIIVAKGLKEGWTYPWIIDRLNELWRKLHEAVEGFVVGLGHRIEGQNKGSAAVAAAQGSSA
jgi:hypothetical protein